MPFKHGKSGNPAGRPRGIADKRTAANMLLKPYAEELTKKAVELALAGNTIALRICIERLIPKVDSEPLIEPTENDADIQRVAELLKTFERQRKPY